MSLKNRFFSLLTVALSVAAFSTFTMAQDSTGTAPAPQKSDRHMRGEGRGMGKGGHHGGMRGHGMYMLQAANLTDAQKEQVRAIHEANKPDAAVMEEMKTLRAAKHAGTLTADQQARLTVLKQQQHEKMQSVHEQVMNILTPEQKAAVEAKKAEMKQRRQERRQNRQENPAVTDEKLEG